MSQELIVGLADGPTFAPTIATQSGVLSDAAQKAYQAGIDHTNWLIDQYVNHGHYGGQQPVQMATIVERDWFSITNLPVPPEVKAVIDQFNKGGTGVHKSIASSLGGLVSKIAPALSAIPGLGPIASTVANIAGKGLTDLTAHPVSGALGDITAIAASAVEGVVSAPGTLIKDAASLAQGAGGWLQGFISPGTGLVQQFGQDVWSSIEKADPSLSGELTTLWHSLGNAYTAASGQFDGWTRQLKNAPSGQYTARSADGSDIFTIIKDAAGHFMASHTSASTVSPTVLNNLPAGTLRPSDPSLYGMATSPVGQPAPGAQGFLSGPATVPAGAWPSAGPSYNGDSMAPDSGMTAPKPAVQEAGSSWLVYALGAGALAMVLKGGRGRGPLTRRAHRRR